MTYEEQTSLGEVRDQFEEELLDLEEHQCPVCRHPARIYMKRTISGAMARELIWLHNTTRVGEYVLVPEESKEFAKLRYWGLIVSSPERREDGGHLGLWCITDKGRLFATGKVKVPKYAMTIHAHCLNLHGPQVDVNQRLGKKFNLQELLKVG